jgi:DNA-binding MarR family transcriptional regulator
MNSSDAERFDGAYGRVWRVLHRGDDADLSEHERHLLHHVPASGGVPLNALARHMALPKSSASVLVKDLARRGFIRRSRDPADERRLAIALTPRGARRVRADTVLDPHRLSAALDALPPRRRAALLEGLERLATAGEALGPARRPRRRSRARAGGER